MKKITQKEQVEYIKAWLALGRGKFSACPFGEERMGDLACLLCKKMFIGQEIKFRKNLDTDPCPCYSFGGRVVTKIAKEFVANNQEK